MKRQGEDGHLQARREASEETSCADTLIFVFQPPEPQENKCPLGEPPPAVLCMAALANYDTKRAQRSTKSNSMLPSFHVGHLFTCPRGQFLEQPNY